MENSNTKTLSEIPGGSTCRVASGGMRENASALRSAAFGLMPGVPVQVIRNNGRGPVVVHARDTYLALGRKMARKLNVVLDGDTNVSAPITGTKC